MIINTVGGGDSGSLDPAELEPKHNVVSYIITASGWNQNTGVYSFEDTYPSSTYDIEDIMLDAENITDSQKKAWLDTNCGGYYSTNIIIATGSIPSVDIPVKLFIKRKEVE